MFYGFENWNNGLYILNLDNQILNVNKKRMRLDKLNKIYLWHCRLGHVNEKRIYKLYKDGYLDSFDYGSYDRCETCLLGKMAKMPFTGKGEWASDLLGLINTDVCGPMSITAWGGFTDDHSAMVMCI